MGPLSLVIIKKKEALGNDGQRKFHDLFSALVKVCGNFLQQKTSYLLILLRKNKYEQKSRDGVWPPVFPGCVSPDMTSLWYAFFSL